MAIASDGSAMAILSKAASTNSGFIVVIDLEVEG